MKCKRAIKEPDPLSITNLRVSDDLEAVHPKKLTIDKTWTGYLLKPSSLVNLISLTV